MNAEEPSTTWDHIIIGAGSAGATLAARLSEDPDRTVLLIEAGGRDRSMQILVPGLIEGLLTSDKFNWNYPGEADPSLGGRSLIWAAGRVMGGSSSINGMVYGRGLPADYARWEAAGNPGWGWEDMLPWFRKAERWIGPPHPTRGNDGPLAVRRFEETNPACAETMAALVALGVPYVEDYCTGITDGIGLTQATQRRGLRHSTAAAYLHHSRHRSNLTIMTHSRALRLLLDGDRCVGVRIVRKGTEYDLYARLELALCAGALGSPKLLLLSGIGAPEVLEPHDIKVLHPLDGVGRNLNDHMNVKLSAFVDSPTYNSQRRGLAALYNGMRLVTCRSGPATSPANHVQAFVRSNPARASADVQIQLMAFGFGSEDDMRQDGITAVVSPCHPEARGQVTLRSADSAASPRIRISILESAEDRAVLMRGCRLAAQALADGPGRTMGGRLYAPPPRSMRDSDWLDFFRRTAALNWHPTSTCRMGHTKDDVVDGTLRVHGLSGLAVVDASVMPAVTSGNTNAPVIAIAERAAMFIKSRT